jgi:hypothetical protein
MLDKKVIGMLTTLLIVIISNIASAQMGIGHRHGNEHGLWLDSLEVIELSGTVIVDSSFFHPMYYLDEDGDGQADFQLAFGPYWYQPQNGAVRPKDGDVITLTGTKSDHNFNPIIIVFTLNGLEWRQAIEVGEHGWNHMGFWLDSTNVVEVSGKVHIDTAYFYPHYFLDTNGDTLPEYHLNFGPPWFMPRSGIQVPEQGQEIKIEGSLYSGMFGFEPIMVFKIDDEVWRSAFGPAPWSGNWVHRNALDSAYVYYAADSLSRIGFAPGAMMGGMMGQMNFLDSMFVQFERIHPDFIPGEHDTNFFAGFYINLYQPNGQTMMFSGGGMGIHHGRMRFNRSIRYQFHYDDSDLLSRNLDEHHIRLLYRDEDDKKWHESSGFSNDTENNQVTLSNENTYSYFTLTSLSTLTGVESPDDTSPFVAEQFQLHANYPNPFNMKLGVNQTIIPYQLLFESEVSVTIYDVMGRLVWSKNVGLQLAGKYELIWNGLDSFGRTVVSGIYFLNIKVGKQNQTIKLNVVR